jgi:uncharacterized protein YecA (UPF0149 family)
MWVLVVVIVLLAGLALQVEARNSAIVDLREASSRVEVAAVNTEQILTEIIQQQQTPEGQAQDAQIRQAVQEIFNIKQLLCVIIAQQEEALGAPTPGVEDSCP